MNSQATDAELVKNLLAETPPEDGLQVSGALRRTSGGALLVVDVGEGEGAALEAWRLRLEGELRRRLKSENARVVLTSNRGGAATAAAPTAAKTAPRGGGDEKLLTGVRHVLAVGSGKGGVGKSTVAMNLAVGMSRGGWRVGLLDADIYGPSQALMFGLGTAEVQDGKVIPGERGGVKVISMGQLVPDGRAAIWRGPMIQGALVQLLGQVEWGDLDCLVVDLPPGTGDIPLTLCQRVDVSGVVLVSTPQEVSLLDVRKACGMFRRLSVRVLGAVENMSGYVCGGCGELSYPFGSGGVREWSESEGVLFLGEVPLDGAVRESGDGGVSVVEAGGVVGDIFAGIADCLRRELEKATN
ncbi:MAG: Mrp/NBP35 family ATP-binding protein [Alphaproteobacteria bacterium]|nr:Mrp/NBP35 family ATP-binding protein [Alphaproteobacteria bacterium]MDA8006239.1 Mrp/NBP35 family ATP-binding protein [Alphaproteobacteria bacterium]MDA8013623.1 Mrp/NBP35 family ATP-binding protein [Alphaproteobacteria bacterium]